MEEISLLPYHEGGQSKSQQIGKPYHLPGARCPGEEHVQRLVKIASEMGVSVTVGNYKGDVSLELYPYFDTPVEAGREGRAYLLSIFQEAGLDLETQDGQ